MPKDFNYTGYNNELRANSRTLRKRMTPEEKQLWYHFLKNYPVRFNRQRPIDRYIVDFYSSKAKVAIEIDGCQHYEEKNLAEDQNRTAVINSFGVDVLRFSNYDIKTNFEGVCQHIDKFICNKLGLQSHIF